jgi:hypothetical protein
MASDHPKMIGIPYLAQSHRARYGIPQTSNRQADGTPQQTSVCQTTFLRFQTTFFLFQTTFKPLFLLFKPVVLPPIIS